MQKHSPSFYIFTFEKTASTPLQHTHPTSNFFFFFPSDSRKDAEPTNFCKWALGRGKHSCLHLYPRFCSNTCLLFPHQIETHAGGKRVLGNNIWKLKTS